MNKTITEGPFGFPMTTRQAKMLDDILKKLTAKDREYRKTVFHKAPVNVSAPDNEQQYDVSWISTETPDRYGEVMIAGGMDDSEFALNPIVTLNHCYTEPPIGNCAWRKRATQGKTVGIQAKTIYPTEPEGFQGVWAPTNVFLMVQAGLLNAKSIGWLPVEWHYPDQQEAAANGWTTDLKVIDKWILIEYAVGTIPVNPETVVQMVPKTITPQIIDALGWDPELFKSTNRIKDVVPFTTMKEIEKRIGHKLSNMPLTNVVRLEFD